jgi:hypothetical protein
MAVYRMLLLGAGARLAAVRRFSALSDKEAIAVARGTLEDAPHFGFELWLDDRRVTAEEARSTNEKRPLGTRPRGSRGKRARLRELP